MYNFKYKFLSHRDYETIDEFKTAISSNIGKFDIHSGNINTQHMYENGKVPIRASSVKTFTDCQFKFFKNNVQNTQYGMTNSLASIIGTAIHYGVEIILTEVMTSLSPENEEEQVDLGTKAALAIFENLLVTVDFTKEYVDLDSKQLRLDKIAYKDLLEEKINDNYNKAKQIITDGMTQYCAVILPDTNPMHVERVLTFEFRGNSEHPVFSGLQGSMDIEEDNSVRDVKVTGKKQRVVDHVLQLSVYALLRQLNGYPTDLIYIDNIIKNKKIKAVSMNCEPDIALVVETLEAIKAKGQEWHEAKEAKLRAVADGEIPANFKELTLKEEAEIWGGARPFYFLCSETWCEQFSTCPHMQVEEIRLF